MSLRAHKLLNEQYDLKPTKFFDLVRSLSWYRLEGPFLNLHFSRKWLWSFNGSNLISKRLNDEIRRREDFGPYLQIGTVASISHDLGRHYMLTDMTIAQARRVGMFSVSRLSKSVADEAERVQVCRLHEARHIFALSEWTTQSLVDDCGVPRERITVVYAGSNLNLPAHIQEPKKEHEILFVGIDWNRNGGPLLAEAFRLVRAEIPDAVLTIIGCCPTLSDPNVRIEGYLSRSHPDQFERLARCYARAACFCLPSVFDPFPNAIIEAEMVGLPVVALDNGSRREAVINGVTGLLLQEATPAVLAQALITILKNSCFREELGRAAAKYAQHKFTWSRVVAKIYEVIFDTMQ